MHRVRILLLAACLLPGMAGSQEAPDIQRLIEQLGAEDFGDRNAATVALKSHPGDVLPPLLKAREATSDPEMIIRLDELIAFRKLRIVMVPNAPADYWKLWEAGVRDRANTLVIEVEVLGFDGTAKGQQAALQERLEKVENRKPTLLIAPLDPEAQSDWLKDLNRDFIVGLMDGRADAEGQDFFVGYDQEGFGKALGKAVSKTLRGDKVVAFVGIKSFAGTRARIRGLEQQLRLDGIELVKIYEDQADTAKARRNVGQAVREHPDLDAMIGVWQYNGKAILEGLANVAPRKRVQVFASDWDPAVLEALDDGRVDAVVVSQPFEMGQACVDAIAGHAGVVPGNARDRILVPHRLLGKGDGRAYNGEMRKLLQRVK